LVENIQGWGLQKGIEKSLTSQLKGFFRLFGKENDVGAINLLIAFKRNVEALKGTQLTNEQADQLISEAQNIINLIQQ
jgi:hypothetical protein